MNHPPPPRRRILSVIAAFAVLLGGVGLAPAAHAADRGVGFGTWAPLSRTGWHGSMKVGEVHTYCIHPGLPVAVGTTTDHGTTSSVNGLTAQQLVAINHLVTTYGQTDDPVQAAGVGWAVKAIVDLDTTLHSWGYSGDDLAGAIDHIMRRASPENSAAVQERALRYLAEAQAVPVPRSGGAMTLSTRADDPTRGALSVDVDAAATGTLRLDGAVFADSGSAERPDVHGGGVFEIIAAPPVADEGRPYTVRATGDFTVRSAAIRSYSTPGQQESAGPAEPTRFTLSAVDESPRPVRFSPRIATTAEIDAGTFVDEVTFSAADGIWPRREDGSFVVIRATANVYRTGSFPAESSEIPSHLTPVATLELLTDPASGAGTYTVSSPPLPGPGVYTAVWSVSRVEQDAAAAAHLPPEYLWRERFASPSQTQQLAPPPPPDMPPPAPAPTPSVSPPAAPARLAATGQDRASAASLGGAAGAILAIGVAAIIISRRRSTPRH
ncbi:hypothetical protein ACIPVB_10005 [Microbacterium sp. NPDC090007]|uniref:hypothetical protein n=1 Tax=Microbacterium sp. NPDC090007 TaxID=3364204 RepID=UPI00381F5298